MLLLLLLACELSLDWWELPSSSLLDLALTLAYISGLHSAAAAAAVCYYYCCLLLLRWVLSRSRTSPPLPLAAATHAEADSRNAAADARPTVGAGSDISSGRSTRSSGWGRWKANSVLFGSRTSWPLPSRSSTTRCRLVRRSAPIWVSFFKRFLRQPRRAGAANK